MQSTASPMDTSTPATPASPASGSSSSSRAPLGESSKMAATSPMLVVEEASTPHESHTSSSTQSMMVTTTAAPAGGESGVLSTMTFTHTSSSSTTSSFVAAPLSSSPPLASPMGLVVSDTTVSTLTLAFKWNGNEYALQHPSSDSVANVKEALYVHTGVLPIRMKLIGMKLRGKPAPDEALLQDIEPIKAGTRIMMLGTREEDIFVDQKIEEDNIVNDLDVPLQGSLEVHQRVENIRKIELRVQNYDLNVRNPPRVGKKLLVLDIDYTLFDHRSPASNVLELMRPFLHEFLTAAYEHYDLIIWSATSMRWVEMKMQELGVLGNENYRIVSLIDSRAMISVDSPKYGLVDCKPLAVIWGKFPGIYHAKNTIMFDDLRRNFLMNKANGLRIRSFRDAHVNRATDRELLLLSEYLWLIRDLEDLSSLNHAEWESYIKSHPLRRL